jgi:quinol monooxygenase YgiN
MGEGALNAAHGAMATMLAASRAEEGCVSYAYAVDVLDPSKLHSVEKWTDEAALAFHFQTPHMAAFQAALGSLEVEITELAKFQADDGSPVM